jgi:hypothetical protein
MVQVDNKINYSFDPDFYEDFEVPQAVYYVNHFRIGYNSNL